MTGKHKRRKKWYKPGAGKIVIRGREIAEGMVTRVVNVAKAVYYNDVLHYKPPRAGMSTVSYLGELQLSKKDIGQAVRLTFFMESGARDRRCGTIVGVRSGTVAEVQWEGLP